jgi:hypothetical protein
MQLREALRGVREALVLAGGPGFEAGADEFHPFMACAIIQAKLDCLCSASVFLHDFCSPDKFPCDIFGASFQSVCPMLWHTSQEIGKVRLDQYFGFK